MPKGKSLQDQKELSATATMDFTTELLLHTKAFTREKNQAKGVDGAKTVRGRRREGSKNKRESITAFSSKNRGIQGRIARDEATTAEEARNLEKSQVALEKKARLYEALHRGESVEGWSGQAASQGLLVDFDGKYQEDLQYQPTHPEPLVKPSGDVRDEEDLVEYVDDFGRTRMIPRSELPDEEDEGEEDDEGRSVTYESRLGPSEHYDAREENRAMGVGFYQFSQDDEKRRQQQRDLEALREETTRAQQTHTSVEERRQQVLDRRRALLQERKRRRIHSSKPEEERSETTNAIDGLLQSLRPSTSKEDDH